MRTHPHYLDSTAQDNLSIEYTEKHKQGALDLLCSMNRFQWALHWDIDEVWEDAIVDKMQKQVVNRSENHLKITWANMWENHQSIRCDGLMRPSPRVKFYKISDGLRWYFDHPITYGCKIIDSKGRVRIDQSVEGSTDIVCLHAGLMTNHWRTIHRERWDRVYGKAVGKNPYQLWHAIMDPVMHPVTTVPNIWRKEPIRCSP